MTGDWIDVDRKCPKLRGDTSALVLIAKPLRSRPKRLVVSVGYLQKFNDGDCVWVDALSRVPDFPSVRYWMPWPEPPNIEDSRAAVGACGGAAVEFGVEEPR